MGVKDSVFRWPLEANHDFQDARYMVVGLT